MVRKTIIKIIRRILHFFSVLIPRLNNIFKYKNGLNKKSRAQKIIISLTSYPQRFDTVFLTIEALLNQTYRPDKVVLWLAKDEVEAHPLPKSLTKLVWRGLRIKLVDENLKSYKKLIYAIEEFSDCIIISCDDDIVYPREFVAELYQSYLRNPDCISAFRCRVAGIVGKQIAPYNTWQFGEKTNASHQLFFTGNSGVLYPPNSLDKRAVDRIFLNLAPNADDIWFKVMALLRHTKVAMVREKSTNFPLIKIAGSQKNSLWQTNKHKNDEQIAKVFAHFKLSGEDLC